jgi:hypothetical protein
MSYTICYTQLANNCADVSELKDEIVNDVIVNERDVYEFISAPERYIYRILKIYKYGNISLLCLYDCDFPNTDYIGNYTSLPTMYGPTPLNNIDICLIRYMQDKNDEIKVIN